MVRACEQGWLIGVEEALEASQKTRSEGFLEVCQLDERLSLSYGGPVLCPFYIFLCSFVIVLCPLC